MSFLNPILEFFGWVVKHALIYQWIFLTATLVQVMLWCRYAANHCLGPCSARNGHMVSLDQNELSGTNKITCKLGRIWLFVCVYEHTFHCGPAGGDASANHPGRAGIRGAPQQAPGRPRERCPPWNFSGPAKVSNTSINICQLVKAERRIWAS